MVRNVCASERGAASFQTRCDCFRFVLSEFAFSVVLRNKTATHYLIAQSNDGDQEQLAQVTVGMPSEAKGSIHPDPGRCVATLEQPLIRRRICSPIPRHEFRCHPAAAGQAHLRQLTW